jgi:phosphate transport system protein
VRNIDKKVNARRLAIEEKCFQLIVMQQPAARDLRAIMAVNMMIVDLERMGDQAKSIGRIIPMLADFPKWTGMIELQNMGDMVGAMLHQSMDAYAHGNIELASVVTDQDEKVDELFDNVVSKVVEKMASTQKQKKIKVAYDLLRIARALERFGDLAVNVAERVVYISTGTVTI